MLNFKNIFKRSTQSKQPMTRHTFEHFWKRLTLKKPILHHPDTIIEIRVTEFQRLLQLAYTAGVADSYEEVTAGNKTHQTMRAFRERFNKSLDEMKMK